MTPVADKWVEWLQAAWKIALQDAKPRRADQRLATFDSHGLNSYSEMVGRINACQALEPDLIHAGFSPIQMKKLAADVAWEGFDHGA